MQRDRGTTTQPSGVVEAVEVFVRLITRSSRLSIGAALLACGLATGVSLAGTRPRAAPARASAECLVPGTRKTIDELWHPDMSAAISYADTRTGDIAFAARTDDRFYGYRPDHVEWSASVVKAMLMVAYLDEPWVADRPIDAYDNSLLIPMITVSDNDAADRVDELVGSAGLDALARRVRMTHFVAAAPIWGETQITASDQTLFFLHIGSFIVPRHRRYGMHLWRASSRRSDGASARWHRGVGRSTSRAVGGTVPACLITRSCCSSAGVRAWRSRF